MAKMALRRALFVNAVVIFVNRKITDALVEQARHHRFLR